MEMQWAGCGVQTEIIYMLLAYLPISPLYIVATLTAVTGRCLWYFFFLDLYMT